MTTGNRKPPNFFPPLEQMLSGAAIVLPAYLASNFGVASRSIHAILFGCHALTIVVLLWIVFVAPRLAAKTPEYSPKAGIDLQLAGCLLLPVVLAAYVSWHLISHWSPTAKIGKFIVTAISCGIVFLEFAGWSEYRRQLFLRKLGSLVEAEKLQDALALLQLRLKKAKPHSMDHLYAANLYWKLEQYDQAQSIFDDVLTRSERAPIVLNNVASGYLALKRHLDALSLIDEAISNTDAPMVEMLINRCLCLIALGRRDEARDQFKVLEQRPGLTTKKDPAIQSALATIRSSITAE